MCLREVRWFCERVSCVRGEAEDSRRSEVRRLDERSSLVSEEHEERSSVSVRERSLQTISVTVEGGPYWLVMYERERMDVIGSGEERKEREDNREGQGINGSEEERSA
jgi:hypothetical protein